MQYHKRERTEMRKRVDGGWGTGKEGSLAPVVPVLGFIHSPQCQTETVYVAF